MLLHHLWKWYLLPLYLLVMHFFHVKPVGKLLPFFSKDIDMINDVLVNNVLMLQIFGWILNMAMGVVTYEGGANPSPVT